MSDTDVHFKLLCNDKGQVIGVEPPLGETMNPNLNGISHVDNPVEGVIGIETIHILMKPGSVKVCCVVNAGKLYCWC